MSWITFAYSLPKKQSSARVTLWRRLQRLGAVAPAGNLYILPALDECIESFQWLTQEIQQKGGQAIMAHCEEFGGMDQQAIIDLFCEARAKEYADVSEEISVLENRMINADTSDHDNDQTPTQIAKLRRQYTDIARIDYFNCPDGIAIAERLASLERRMLAEDEIVKVTVLASADYQNRTWITRPQPHVDRLASIWLIQRFIDTNATIRYGSADSKRNTHAITFDMPNAQFGHTGRLCTFETLIATFEIKVAGLAKIAEIVHEIDLHDGLYNHPETAGIDMLLKGWRKQSLSNQALEERGLALFDGLLAANAQ